MVSFKPVWIFMGIVALAGGAATTRADAPVEAPSTPVVEVVSTRTAGACDELSSDEARRAARLAERRGAHRRAADCFRVAGDHVRADRALLRASAQTSEVTSDQVAASVEAARMQARRLREAFR